MRSSSGIQAIKEARRRKLAALMDASSKFELGKLLDMNPDYLWQMAKGQGVSARGVSDKTARAIEEKLGKPAHWLEWDGDEPGDAPASQSAGLDVERMRFAAKFLEDLFDSYGRVFVASERIPLLQAVYVELSSETPPNVVALTRKFGNLVEHEDEREAQAGSAGADGRRGNRRSASKA